MPIRNWIIRKIKDEEVLRNMLRKIPFHLMSNTHDGHTVKKTRFNCKNGSKFNHVDWESNVHQVSNF